MQDDNEGNFENDEDGDKEEKTESKHKNYWGSWCNDIYYKTRKYCTQRGSDENPYFLYEIKLSNKLLRDMELFPIWGNIFGNHFTGRIPASSASVESEFNKYKNVVLHDVKKSSIRVDECVNKYLEYLVGKTNIINMKLDGRKNEDSNNVEDILFGDNGGKMTFSLKLKILLDMRIKHEINK